MRIPKVYGRTERGCQGRGDLVGLFLVSVMGFVAERMPQCIVCEGSAVASIGCQSDLDLRKSLLPS